MPNLPSGDGQNVKDQSLSVVLASDHDPIAVDQTPVSTVIAANLAAVTVGVAEVAVGSGTATAGVLVQAQRANTVPVYVGKTGVVVGTGVELGPGDSIFLALSDVAAIFAIAGAAAQKVSGVVI